MSKVNPKTILVASIVIALFVLGILLGARYGENLVRTEMGDRRSDMQVIGWCVKSNLEGFQASGAPYEALVAELPKVQEYCTQSWADFKEWVDLQIEASKKVGEGLGVLR
jgi:hypothetical protein